MASNCPECGVLSTMILSYPRRYITSVKPENKNYYNGFIYHYLLKTSKIVPCAPKIVLLPKKIKIGDSSEIKLKKDIKNGLIKFGLVEKNGDIVLTGLKIKKNPMVKYQYLEELSPYSVTIKRIYIVYINPIVCCYTCMYKKYPESFNSIIKSIITIQQKFKQRLTRKGSPLGYPIVQLNIQKPNVCICISKCRCADTCVCNRIIYNFTKCRCTRCTYENTYVPKCQNFLAEKCMCDECVFIEKNRRPPHKENECENNILIVQDCECRHGMLCKCNFKTICYLCKSPYVCWTDVSWTDETKTKVKGYIYCNNCKIKAPKNHKFSKFISQFKCTCLYSCTCTEYQNVTPIYMWNSDFPGIGTIVDYTKPVYCSICHKNNHLNSEDKFTVDQLGSPYAKPKESSNEYNIRHSPILTFTELLVQGPSSMGPIVTAPYLHRVNTLDRAFSREEDKIEFKKNHALIMHAAHMSVKNVNISLQESDTDLESRISNMII